MTMQEAVNAASKLQSFLELFQRASDVLTAAANAEATEQSLRNRIEGHERELAHIEAKTKETVATLGQAKFSVEESKSRAIKVIADANTYADRKSTESAKALADSNAEIDRRRTAFTAEVKSFNDELSGLRSQIKAATNELNAVQKKIADAKAAALAALS